MKENNYGYEVRRVEKAGGNVTGGKKEKNTENGKAKQAIALEYNPQEEAPKVVASGRGLLAERIIEKAKEAKVPVHQDHKLADTLSRLEIGEMIPPQLYDVVAEILVFVDAMDKIKSKGFTGDK